MSEFENDFENKENNDNVSTANTTAEADNSSSKFTNDAPRVDGEYHYSGGYSERTYSDAHYVPESESTVPPRYYKPPETKAKEPRPAKPKKNGGKWAAIVAICLVCALLGGLGGAAIVSHSVNSRLDTLEAGMQEMSENKSVLTTAPSVSSSVGESSDSSALPASEIYELACSQVVGISSEITYQNFFGMNSSAAVSGSGFILTSDGYILTNYHVIEDAYESKAEIKVMTHDGTSYPATIVGFESDNDIAVLKIEAENLTPVTLGDSDSLKVGDVVYAVGNPLGELEFSMSTGHVSAKDRLIDESSGAEAINMFQLDAAVNSGNSGGPVYNAQGQVIGIVTAKYSSSGVEGLGFAIPINDAESIANDLITKGYVTGKAYMSLSIRNDYTSMYAQYYGWPMGAMVAEVNAGGAAEKAGIQAGDIITKVDGETVENYSDLKSAVKKYSAGDTAEITLYRAGEEMTVTITFDEVQPETETEQSSSSDSGNNYYDDYSGRNFGFSYGAY